MPPLPEDDAAAGIPRRTPERLGDPAIRAAVRRDLRRRQPDALVAEELTLGDGRVRADVVTIGRRLLHAVEIKGEGDSTSRLASQAVGYSATFDTVVLALHPRHLDHALDIVPGWWGLTTATVGPRGVALTRVRPPLRNPAPDTAARLGLLWRQELVDLAAGLGERGLSRRNRHELITRIAPLLTAASAGAHVAAVLRAREDWLDETGARRANSAEWDRRRAADLAARLERERKHRALLASLAAHADESEADLRSPGLAAPAADVSPEPG